MGRLYLGLNKIKKWCLTPLFLIFIITASAIIFRLPYRLLPLFLRCRYGISTKIEKIIGGFKDGIVLTNVRLSRGGTSIGCKGVITDIRIFDLLFPDRGHRHNIYVDMPRISVDKTQSGTNGFLGIPLWLDTDILIHGAELSFGEDLPVRFEGGARIENSSIVIDKMQFLLGGLELDLRGDIDSSKNLNLSCNFIDSENSFSIKGPLNRPYINTHWSGLDTSFQIEDIKYENGQLVIPRLTGSIYIEGFPRIDIDGGLYIDKDHIKFKDMTILNTAHINGVVNKDKPSRIKLSMDNVDGAKLAARLPEVLQVLILSHKINADVNIYGMMDNLQAGGIIRLLSAPIEISCRYRNNKFSFRSRHGGSATLGEGPFSICGSIDWNHIPRLKIKGIFSQMDIKELMGLLGKEADAKWKGVVDGEFNITGELGAPLIDSKLEITDVELGSMKFDVAYLNLQGTGSGPLNLAHSMVYYKEIPAELTGFIDPKEGDVFKNIEIRPVGDEIIWEGINIMRDAEGGSVTIQKDVDENISVRFKSALTSDSGESEEEKPEVELEYKLREDKNLLIKMQEDEGTVGVEHKVKF